MKKLFAEPLVQFLLIGGCIYLAFALFGTPEEDSSENRIHVDSNRIEGFISQWEKRWNRLPTKQEIDGLIQSHVREEVLYRQAVSMGLNEDDAITRRRMAQKLEFLTSDLAQSQQPAEGQLEQFFTDNEATYRAPDRISFSQVFFNPDTRKDATLDEAKAERAKLEAAGKPDPETLEAGDKSMLQDHFPNVTEAEVSRQMGSGFAESAMELKPGEWHGPVLSGYGVHLVYVYEMEKGAVPALEDVRDKVLADWHDEQREAFNAEFLKNLKDRYDIVIDEMPAERLIDGNVETIVEPVAEPVAETPSEAEVSTES